MSGNDHYVNWVGRVAFIRIEICPPRPLLLVCDRFPAHLAGKIRGGRGHWRRGLSFGTGMCSRGTRSAASCSRQRADATVASPSALPRAAEKMVCNQSPRKQFSEKALSFTLNFSMSGDGGKVRLVPVQDWQWYDDRGQVKSLGHLHQGLPLQRGGILQPLS
jgi:hypothetical protein